MFVCTTKAEVGKAGVCWVNVLARAWHLGLVLTFLSKPIFSWNLCPWLCLVVKLDFLEASVRQIHIMWYKTDWNGCSVRVCVLMSTHLAFCWRELSETLGHFFSKTLGNSYNETLDNSHLLFLSRSGLGAGDLPLLCSSAMACSKPLENGFIFDVASWIPFSLLVLEVKLSPFILFQSSGNRQRSTQPSCQ